MGKKVVFAMALLVVLFSLWAGALGEGVAWTGLEWNGDTKGEIGQRNCDIVQIGRQPARTDSIPYQSAIQAAQGANEYNKGLSPYYLLLSQSQWQFSYYDCPADFDNSSDKNFWQQGFDSSAWDQIFVPSVWQTQGYDRPIYTNTTQKFARNFGNEKIGYPRDLPKAPTVYNPVGLYRRTFALPRQWAGQRLYLDFEGVSAAFYVWVNGVQIGYAEDSFTTSEFDITDAVYFDKENTIAVKVFRWCDGSWLEDQDYFDLSGIFRDVYLYTTPQVRVEDFTILTDFDETFTNSTLFMDVEVTNYTALAQPMDLSLTLMDGEGRTVSLEATAKSALVPPGELALIHFAIKVPAPRKWSAEDPYLYTLVLKEDTQAASVFEAVQVGFRKITYKTTASGWYEGATDDQDLIRINGQPISLRGVNRHEMHPELGYALTREVMEEDIRIMLENNINAVRTSHYPNSPYWYYLCDQYGIYVMDEANVECHSNMINENQRITDYMSASIIDREYNMVHRDRNHPSVIMWSLGNECKNPEILSTILVKPYPDPQGVERVLHEYTADRPWHYEQAREMYETGIDVYSGMYYKADVLVAHGQKDGAAPMIECEYTHAMGNSMGNLDEYWQAFDTYRNLQGGFIWDFVDQAIYATNEDGTRYFGYGGDFGERVHDDNFCANGLLLPDRTLQPEMAEVRYHYQQVKFEEVDLSKGLIRIKNFFLFTDIAEKYDLHWTLLRDDTPLQAGVLQGELLHIPQVNSLTNQPGVGEIRVPFTFNEIQFQGEAEYFLNLSLRLKQADGPLAQGFQVAWEQFEITPESPATKEKAETAEEFKAVTAQRAGGTVTVETETMRVAFSEGKGQMITFEALDDNGDWRHLLLEGEGPQGDFFRASTDNDRAFGAGLNIYIGMWKEKGDYIVEDFLVDDTRASLVTIEVKGTYPALNQLALNTKYTIYGNGFIAVEATIAPRYDANLVYLPVAGMSMKVPQEFEQLFWFGNGPEETYIDRWRGTGVGRWQTTVGDNYFPYVQSSETGNHIGTRTLALVDEKGFGLQVTTTKDPFEFSALHYSAADLDREVHPYELNPLNETVLRINAIQMGIGGDDSWSRIVTHEEYLPNASVYHYGYVLSPISAKGDFIAQARGIQRQMAEDK